MKFPIQTLCASDLLPSLGAAVARIVSAAQPQDKPVFLHTLGVPGAGKSSFMKILMPRLAVFNPFYVGFDKLMESTPEYQAEKDVEKAFKQMELPARAAGYFLLEQLISKRAHIVLDHGGSFSQNIEMLRYARDVQNYTILIARVAVDPKTAQRRIWARQAIEGRHTPLDYVVERHGILQSLLPHYKEVADRYFEVSNDSDVANPEETFTPLCDAIAGEWASAG